LKRCRFAISKPASRCPILHSVAIAAAKAKLGKDAVILGQHYRRDEVVKFAELKDRKVIPLDPSVCVSTTMFRITPPHLLWAPRKSGRGENREPDFRGRTDPTLRQGGAR
jgi:quinolinate synthase